MKELRKIFYVLPVFLMLTVSAYAMEADMDNNDKTNEIINSSTGTSENEEPKGDNESRFRSFGGQVMDIAVNDVKQMIRVQDTNDEETVEMDFVIDDNTLFIDENGKIEMDELKTGDSVRGYYRVPNAAILIYPPQMTASAIVIEPAVNTKTIYVGPFNEELISADNTLQINVDKDKDSLTNKILAVIYTTSTKSIPAQTIPENVIVIDEAEGLFEAINPPIQEQPAEPEPTAPEVTSMYSINGTALGNEVGKFYNYKGYTMVPLRTIAEALGYGVEWDAAAKSIAIGRIVQLTVGHDYYVYNQMAPITLGAAPEIIDGSTYVPTSFFSDVLKGKVEISTENISISIEDE